MEIYNQVTHCHWTNKKDFLKEKKPTVLQINAFLARHAAISFSYYCLLYKFY